MMHDGVVAGREAKALQKAFSRLSARGVPEQMNEIQHAACSPKPRLGDPGYALAKDLPLTVAIAAPKTRNPQPDNHRYALDRQILQPSPIDAVARIGFDAAGLTSDAAGWGRVEDPRGCRSVGG